MSKKNELKVLVSLGLGTFLEYLDFSLFAFSITIIALKFFPLSFSNSNIVQAWCISFIGFLFRPLGSIFFGYIGDRFGTRKSLLISMTLMSISTLSIGVIPTYNSIGIYSPALLILCRSIQGFAFSAEYNGAATYFSISNHKKLGAYSSFTVAVIGMGTLTGALIISFVSAGFTAENITEIRWRLPFIISGLLVGVCGILLRKYMIHIGKIKNIKLPIRQAFITQKKEMLICFLSSSYIGIKSYTIFSFIPIFLQTNLNYQIYESSLIAAFSNISMIIGAILSGYISDTYGRVFIMRKSLLALSIITLLSFMTILKGNNYTIVAFIVILSFTSGTFSGCIPAFLSESFKVTHRFSGSAFSYNLGIAIFGGGTPIIMTIISKVNIFLPGLFISIASIFLYIILSKINKAYN